MYKRRSCFSAITWRASRLYAQVTKGIAEVNSTHLESGSASARVNQFNCRLVIEAVARCIHTAVALIPEPTSINADQLTAASWLNVARGTCIAGLCTAECEAELLRRTKRRRVEGRISTTRKEHRDATRNISMHVVAERNWTKQSADVLKVGH